MTSVYTYCVNSIMSLFCDSIESYDPDADGSFQTAIDNIVLDINGAGNPHGNITSVAQESLNSCCKVPHGGKCVDIEKVVRDHHSHQKASGAVARNKPDEDLRRVVPFHTFVDYHHKGGVKALANMVRVGGIKSTTIPIKAMRGETGRDTDPSWWTFGPPPPDNGQQYADELALTVEHKHPKGAAADAAMIKGVVEVRIPPSAFPKEVFKPSALDAFCRNSKFEPDLTSANYGWTKPDIAKVGLARRPELVSQSFSYSEIKPDIDLDVTYLSY
jgi:hypothetical protein